MRGGVWYTVFVNKKENLCVCKIFRKIAENILRRNPSEREEESDAKNNCCRRRE